MIKQVAIYFGQSNDITVNNVAVNIPENNVLSLDPSARASRAGMVRSRNVSHAMTLLAVRSHENILPTAVTCNVQKKG